ALELEGDLRAPHHLGAAQHDLLLQLEVRDAVDEEAADAVVAVVDGDLPALLPELLGRGEAGGPGADDADREPVLDRRLDRPHPALREGRVGDVALDRADGDRAVPGGLDDAIALAEAV